MLLAFCEVKRLCANVPRILGELPEQFGLGFLEELLEFSLFTGTAVLQYECVCAKSERVCGVVRDHEKCCFKLANKR